MNRITTGLAASFLLTASLVLLEPAQPAAAAVVVTSSGGIVTATVTGNATINFTCSSGKVRVAGMAASPEVACNALTSVSVNGDGGNQIVAGRDLDASAFTAHPSLAVSLGDGTDSATETKQADNLNMGDGSDQVSAWSNGANNVQINMGTGADTLWVFGAITNNTMTASSSNANVSVTTTNAGGVSTTVAGAVESLGVYGSLGNDTIDLSGVTVGSALSSTFAGGGAGNDTLTASPKGTVMMGESGKNVFNGGVGHDQYRTSSETDVLHTSAGSDEVFDEDNGHSGGRTIDGSGGTSYYDYLTGCDAVGRVRAGDAGGTRIAAGLCRPGIVKAPSTFTKFSVQFGAGDPVQNRGLADVVASNLSTVVVVGDTADDDVADVTIPSGGWNLSGDPADVLTIDPVNPAYGSILLENIGAYRVHNPISDLKASFAYRLWRDLFMRFGTDGERASTVIALDSGTPRTQIAAGIMNSDEYRGLDVDRVFVRFLHRVADPGGRTYWINALRNGRTLRKFRAQLFGSNEYFANSFDNVEFFVRNAYFDVLGRLPDAAGQTYWVNKINSGTERGAVANAFLVSSEARRALVRDQFLRLLLRYPTNQELDTWMPVLLEDHGEQDLIAFLAGSGAYYTNP